MPENNAPEETLLVSQLFQQLSSFNGLRMSCDTNVSSIRFNGLKLILDATDSIKVLELQDEITGLKAEMAALEIDLERAEKRLAAKAK